MSNVFVLRKKLTWCRIVCVSLPDSCCRHVPIAYFAREAYSESLGKVCLFAVGNKQFGGG